MRNLGFALAAALLAFPAAASDDSQGRIRHTEGGATLQRSSEPGADEAFRNLPFLPGDRVWTDETGRIEFQFGGGSLVRLGERSKLDYMASEDDRGRSRVVLRLWSGALLLHGRDDRGAPDFEIETPAGLVEARGSAVARIDLAFGETRLSVFEGRASFDNGVRSVRLEAGESTLARRGEDPTRPARFDRRDADEFARWDEMRERQADWASDEARYLPAEVAPFADDLRGHGSWHLETEIGYVWQPRVSPGWRPYQNGRWTWSQYGWTWVPNEPWGWAPSHYGRWGNSASLGWYWIPGSTWGPAWVTWSVGNDYVGWSPLGWRDRPVTMGSRNLGNAVERGSGSPWTYARRTDMAARDVSRRRVDLSEQETQSLRVVEPKSGHVDRSVRVVEGAQPRGESAAPRNVQIRPTPGDTIPELRSDPATTIPFPMVRRKYPSEDERREREAKERPSTQRTRFGEAPTAAQESPAPEKSRPADNASAVRSTPRERTKEPEDQDKDVLRRMFTPLSRTKDKEPEARPSNEGAAARSRPRETPRESPAPTKAEPRATPSPREEGAVRRKKDPSS